MSLHGTTSEKLPRNGGAHNADRFLASEEMLDSLLVDSIGKRADSKERYATPQQLKERAFAMISDWAALMICDWLWLCIVWFAGMVSMASVALVKLYSVLACCARMARHDWFEVGSDEERKEERVRKQRGETSISKTGGRMQEA